MTILLFVIKVIWFIAPAGMGNMAPVLLRHIPILAYPIDFGKKINNEPLFGANKTWRGLIFAPLVGMLTFWIQKILFDAPDIQAISIFNYDQAPVYYGALLGFGAIFGDLVKSFFKRRFRIPPGVSWFPFDQIDYSVGALLFLSPWFFPGWGFALSIIAVGVILHLLANIIGHLLKLRKDWI